MSHDKVVQQATGTLSVCMIVRNEAMLLGRCLSSVHSVADEIVVVDTGSEDTTIEVACRFNAKIIQSDWRDDFSYSRNISIEHATSEWILWLDADDVVPVSSLDQLHTIKKMPADRIYSFIVRNERPGNTGTEFVQARMFPNRKELRFERCIHEQITPSALRIGMAIEQYNVVIEHHGYADPQLLKKKAGRNIRLLLQEYPRIAPDPVMAAEIADAYWLVEDRESAAHWYREVIALTGETSTLSTLASHANYGLGNIYNKDYNFTDAIIHLERAFRLAPWRSDILYSLAVSFESVGDIATAVEKLYAITAMEVTAGQVGVDFRLTKIKAYLRLIRIFTENGNLEEGKDIIAKAVAIVGTRPEIHTGAGKFYLKNGMLIEALHAFEQSITLRNEGNIEAFIGLCLIYRSAHREEMVIKTLDAIAPRFSDNIRYRVARIILLDEPHSRFPDTAEFQHHVDLLQRDFYGLL